MTIKFTNMMKNYNYYPKILNKNPNELKIEMENCGDLLSIKSLPENWEDQFNEIRKSFIEKQIYILDLRFMPHTPLIVNNVCLKNNKIYLVDLVMFRTRNTEFINNKFDNLIKQIKMYKNILNNKICGYFIIFCLHIYFEISRMIYDIFERIYYQDI